MRLNEVHVQSEVIGAAVAACLAVGYTSASSVSTIGLHGRKRRR
jgi:hypothetical protein